MMCSMGTPATPHDVAPARRVRVAAVNDYELVVEGVAALLQQYPERLEVCARIVVGEPITVPVDVALYDTYGRARIAAPALRALVRDPDVRYVAIFSFDLRPQLISDARAAGATGFVSKSLSGNEIADAIVRVATGEVVESLGRSSAPALEHLTWPGKEEGLSERESQVLVLCAEGLSNREIANALYVGTETVKSHLRNVFAKLGVHNRVEVARYVERSDAFARQQSRSRSDDAAG
jgi:DNA-binding NarL/FixJ family response regulator